MDLLMQPHMRADEMTRLTLTKAIEDTEHALIGVCLPELKAVVGALLSAITPCSEGANNTNVMNLSIQVRRLSDNIILPLQGREIKNLPQSLLQPFWGLVQELGALSEQWATIAFRMPVRAIYYTIPLYGFSHQLKQSLDSFKLEGDFIRAMIVEEIERAENAARSSPLDITELVEFSSSRPERLGGFCDVYRGRHTTEGVVALKLPRIRYSTDAIQRRFWREVDLWHRCKHENILALLGVVEVEIEVEVEEKKQKRKEVYMVSRWAEKGTLSEFLRREPNADRLLLIHGWVSGVAYLHSQGIVHGDIKAANILVNGRNTPLLIDFGLSKSTEHMNTSSEMRGAGSTRWLSPEVLECASKSMPSDVFAVAITMYETLSGRIPFDSIKHSSGVINAIARGERPPLEPKELNNGESLDAVWNVVTKAWNGDSDLRPTIGTILSELSRFTSEKPNPHGGSTVAGGSAANHPARTALSGDEVMLDDVVAPARKVPEVARSSTNSTKTKSRKKRNPPRALNQARKRLVVPSTGGEPRWMMVVPRSKA